MGFLFNRVNEIINGVSYSLKKEYSSFLNASSFHFSDFKIEELQDILQGALLSKFDGNYKLYLSLKKNNHKIDEFQTSIFDFVLNNNLIESSSKIKPFDEFVSLEEYLKYNNIEYQSLKDKHDFSFQNRYIYEYLKFKNTRSYYKYLLDPQNKYLINKYIEIILGENKELNDVLWEQRLKLNTHANNIIFKPDEISDKYLLDCLFKKIDPFERKVVNSLKDVLKIDNELMKCINCKSFNHYQNFDKWILKFTVILQNKIVFEDIQLVNGEYCVDFEIPNDDFYYLSDGIQDIMTRWNFHKKYQI